MGKVITKVFGLIFIILEFLMSVVFCGFLYSTNFMTFDWMLIVILALLILLLINLIMQRWLVTRIIAILLALLISLCLGYGCYMIHTTTTAIAEVADGSTEIDQIDFYVLGSNQAQTLTDAQDYTFGILAGIDRENTDFAISQAETSLGSSLTLKEYDDLNSLADGLLNGEVEAVILNAAYIDVITDSEDYKDFSSQIRILSTISRETQPVVVEEVSSESAEEITKGPFIVYVSGCDQSGEISAKGRSDVNILAVVNPSTKQVLLVSTPRDFFVNLSIANGAKDKLAHAGIWGIQVSMDTLSMLYNTDINYYFKCNFTGFKDIVNALGTIEVESDIDFEAGVNASSQSEGHTYTFHQGVNVLDGDAALAFARERHSVRGGDRQRGKNQMQVIKAVIKKMQSTTLLTNYADLMNSIAGSFDTNLTSSQIQALVRMQLEDMASWEVFSYSTNGSNGSDHTYSSPKYTHYVMIPDETTVEKATELIGRVFNGETLTAADVATDLRQEDLDGDADVSSILDDQNEDENAATE